MQCLCTEWVQSFNTRDWGSGDEDLILSKIWISITVLLSFNWSPFLGIYFIARQKSNLCTVLATQNTTGCISIISHPQNTTEHQPSIFLNGIHRQLVTNKGRSAFPRANTCQGQFKTPQSVSVVLFHGKEADCEATKPWTYGSVTALLLFSGSVRGHCVAVGAAFCGATKHYWHGTNAVVVSNWVAEISNPGVNIQLIGYSYSNLTR
jgi:hypothetical protein